MNFIKGFAVTLGLVLFLAVAWPAIIFGIGGIAVIDAMKTPTSQRQRAADVGHITMTVAEQVSLVSVHQSGAAIFAVIKNGSSARIYDMMLSCAGGPSFHNHEGWIYAGETKAREFHLKSAAPHRDCILGYKVDFDDGLRKLGHLDAARSYQDNLDTAASPTFKGAIITVGGAITNYSNHDISFARLKCSFTKGRIDIDYLADIAIAIDAQATSAIHTTFTMSDVPENGIFCKVVNVVYGGDIFR